MSNEVKTKVCSKCGRELPLGNDYFEKRKASKDGFRGVCRECRNGRFLVKKEKSEIIVAEGHKMCSDCKEIKTIDNFMPRKNTKDGYCGTCNTCRGDYDEATNTKVCKKCKQRLPMNPEYFQEDRLCLSGFRNVCWVCRGERYGKRREHNKWTDEEIDILIKEYPYMSNEDLQSKYFPNRKIESIIDKATRVLGLKKNEEYMSERYWTKEQDEYLMDNYSKMNTKEMVNVLGKEVATITARALKLGINKDSFWSDEEIELLNSVYPYEKSSDVQQKYFPNRTLVSINLKARKIGLFKDEDHLKQIQNITGINNIKLAQYKEIDGTLVKVKGSLSPLYKERVVNNCPMCGKEIEMLESRKNGQLNVFCSRDCAAKWKSINMSGENSPLYGIASSLWTEEKKRDKAKKQVEYLSKNNFSFRKTKPQIIVDEVLNSKSIEFKNEYNCKYYLIDNYLTEYNLMIEVQGNFFHCNPTMNIKNSRERKIKSKDKSKHTYIKKKYGVEILYLWEYDILNNISLCEKLIEEYIDSKGVLDNYHSFNYVLDEIGELQLIKDQYVIGY